MKTHSESENHLAVQFAACGCGTISYISDELPRNRESELVRDILSIIFIILLAALPSCAAEVLVAAASDLSVAVKQVEAIKRDLAA